MITGWADNKLKSVRICPEGASAVNYGFDVTPSRLITGFVTEKGICKATPESIKNLYPENYVN